MIPESIVLFLSFLVHPMCILSFSASYPKARRGRGGIRRAVPNKVPLAKVKAEWRR